MQANVLAIEDDLGAYTLLSLAYSELNLPVILHRALDDQDARLYLARRGYHSTAPRPALILLDLNIPGGSGMELLEAFKSDPATADIPVVVFTSSLWRSDRERCMALGASDFIIKPFHYNEMLSAVALAHSYAASA